MTILRYLKRFGEKYLPYSTSKLWFFWSLSGALNHKMRLKKIGCKTFEYNEVFNIFNNVETKEVVIFGNGPSIKELKDVFFEKSKKRLTIAVGRWFFHDFVPNMIYLECKMDNFKWIDDFCNGLNIRKKDYSKTIILIQMESPNTETLLRIKKNLSPSLFLNVRFSSETRSLNCSKYFDSVLSSRIIKNLTILSNTLMHCRSSASIGGSIAVLLKAKKLIVTGVDGYNGYFEGKDNENFHKLAVSRKNFGVNLHSSADPLYGVPTITDCFVGVSKHIPTVVSSKKTNLADYIKTI